MRVGSDSYHRLDMSLRERNAILDRSRKAPLERDRSVHLMLYYSRYGINDNEKMQ